MERLLRDPSHVEDPQHFARRWREDSDFRNDPVHQLLYLALDSLQNYARQSSTHFTANQERDLSAWAAWAHSSSAEEIDRCVLANFTEILPRLGEADVARAEALRGVLGIEEFEPEEEEVSDSAASGEGSSFSMTALTAGLRLDRPQREFVSDLLLGALPDMGVPGYNQTADFGMELGGEFRWGDFRLFGNIAWNHGVVPQGATAAHFEQTFLQLGLLEYSGDRSWVGRENFHLGLGGRNRVGLGIGFRACTGLNADAAAAGATCSDSTAQLSLVGDSDLLSVGYGPVELTVRLISSPYYFNLSEGNHIPSFNNLVPLEFSLIYHLDHPEAAAAAVSSNLEVPLTDRRAVYDGLRVLTTAFQDHLSYRQEAALQDSRVFVNLGGFGSLAGADGQYNLLNLGSFLGGALRGINAGSLAYDLRRDLSQASEAQRWILAGAMAVEPLVHGAAWLFNPRHETAVPSLEESAFYMAMPSLLVRDSLAVLGAVGLFGDRNQAIRGEGIHPYLWLGTHGAMILGGLVMILLSGDGSGSGFLSGTLLGNSRGSLSGTDIEETRYSLASQREQYFRLVAGTTLFTDGARGILDFITSGGRLSPEENAEEPEADSGAESHRIASGPALSLGLETDGRTRGVVSLGGRF